MLGRPIASQCHLILISAFGLHAFWQRADSKERKVDASVALAFLLLLLALYFGCLMSGITDVENWCR